MGARIRGSRAALLSAVLALFACGEDSEDGPAADAYYAGPQSAALGSATNEADCATCHSADGTQEGYPGNTFKDIAYRSSFKGGDAATLLAAANACVTGWMGGEALQDDDPEWQSLEAYLQSLSSPSVTAPNALAPEVLADEDAYAAAYAGGDASAGEAKFGTYCAVCHADGLVVGPAPAWTMSALSGVSMGRIAQKVRTAGPPPSGTADSTDSTPGPMPFFEPKDLPADDLKDIIAYLKQ